MTRLLATALLGLAAAPALAQEPDSLRADSAAVADSLLDETERMLASEGSARERRPAIPFVGAEGPRPSGMRRVFTRDSLDWSGHETLGELLAAVPGVALVRGGWAGRAEAPNYLGQGPGAVTFVLDGIPWEPLGPDSTQVDPGLIGLNALERVEVLRTPGRLEVRLSTRRHDLAAPLSRIGIASGDRDFARYEGLLTQRAASGLGYGLGAEVVDIPDPGGTAEYQHTQGWVQLSWLPGERHGVVAQVVTQDLQRDPVVPTGTLDTLDMAWDGSRAELSLRAFTTRGSDDAPTRLDLFVARSTWSDDELDQAFTQGGLLVEHRRARLVLGGQAALRSGWTTLDAKARVGWVGGRLTATAEGAFQRHRADRTSAWVAGGAGLPLLGGFELRVEGLAGSVVRAPAIDSLEAGTVSNLAAFLRFEHHRLGVEAGIQRLDGPAPLPLAQFRQVATVADSGATTWATGEAQLRPTNWLTLSGALAVPLGPEPEGTPSMHGEAALTIRSRFLRTFPSGFLDFKAELAGEFWGEGTSGRTGAGAPLIMPANALLRAGLEIQLGRFHAFYRRVNLLNRSIEWLPGLPYPNFMTTFGVRWDFLN